MAFALISAYNNWASFGRDPGLTAKVFPDAPPILDYDWDADGRRWRAFVALADACGRAMPRGARYGER